jgi:immune inhibitor A
VPPERVHSGTRAWWGGSQSEANSHMTLSLTLPATATQLKFWTWYALEDGYDWAYALISADGGQTWTSLLTTGADGSGTSAIDPIGTVGALGGNKDYPNGFTGASGSPPNFSGQDVNAPIYSQQTADISTFAGRAVLVRFAYSSDPATDLAGFYVDDLSIVNALGQVLVGDAMEATGSWSPGGSPGFRLVTRSQ